MADKEEEAEAKEEEEAEESEETSTGGGRLKWIALAGVVALAIAGAGAFVLVGGSDEEAEEAEAEANFHDAEELLALEEEEAADSHSKSASGKTRQAVPGHFFSLDTFIVNIKDRERDRFLKIKTELEVSSDSVSQELRSRMPQVKDYIITLLGSKSFQEVRTIEGKDQLREEILARINSMVRTGKVRSVFFTEFVVQ